MMKDCGICLKNKYMKTNVTHDNAITCGDILFDCKEVTGSTVIAYDAKKNLYVQLHNVNTEETWLPSGGLDVGESYEGCALRELKEEAGIGHVEKIIELGVPVISYYYNANKKSNRKSLGYNFLAIVNSDQSIEQHNEEHENFTVSWVTYDELYNAIAKEGEKGVEHWLQALRWAKDTVKCIDNI